MKIDQALNLVTSIEREGTPLFVYVIPFPYETIEQYHVPLAKTYQQFYEQVGPLGSVTTAGMMLRKNIKDDPLTVNSNISIFSEISRFTSIGVFKDGEWHTVMLEQALAAGIISQDEWREVEGEVCFFIVGYAIHKRKSVGVMIGTPLSLFGAQLTPLSFTAWLNTLPKSTTDSTPQEDSESKPMPLQPS